MSVCTFWGEYFCWRIGREMPAEMKAALTNVHVIVKDRPDDVDRARGAAPDQVAYYFGHQRDHQDDDGTALPDESAPSGEIVIFAAHVRPHTLARYRTVLLHEVHHVLGYDEDTIVHHLGYA